MILTEPGLTWRRSLEVTGPRGEACVRYECVEYPRIFSLKQRQNEDAQWRTKFYVKGIEAQHYRTPSEALEAMQANP